MIYRDNIKLGGLKCEFLVQKVEVLGHIIERGVLKPKISDKL